MPSQNTPQAATWMGQEHIMRPNLFIQRKKKASRKHQCSRLKPSYEFHFEGLSNFSLSVEGLVQIQDVNPRIILKWNTKFIMKLCISYMVHVSSTMWRIKNQPSDSTSWSDNTLHLLVFVVGRLYWGLQVTSLFSIWGFVLKGCIARGLFWRAKVRLKGIEDFNLEHWRSSTLGSCPALHFSFQWP